MNTLPISLEFPIDAGALADAARVLLSENLWPVAIRRDIEAEIYWVALAQPDQAAAGQLLSPFAPGRKRGNWRAWLMVAFVVALLIFCLAVVAVVGLGGVHP